QVEVRVDTTSARNHLTDGIRMSNTDVARVVDCSVFGGLADANAPQLPVGFQINDASVIMRGCAVDRVKIAVEQDSGARNSVVISGCDFRSLEKSLWIRTNTDGGATTFSTSKVTQLPTNNTSRQLVTTGLIVVP